MGESMVLEPPLKSIILGSFFKLMMAVCTQIPYGGGRDGDFDFDAEVQMKTGTAGLGTQARRRFV